MPNREQIILIGGGGHCKSCIDVIEAEGKFRISGIVDLKKKIGQKVLGYKIIASDEDIPELGKKFKYFFITIGQTKSPLLRIKEFNLLKSLKVILPVIISPSAYVSKQINVGEGTIIMHRAVVNVDTTIGNNCIINTGAIIEHDTTVGSHCHISTGTIINGGCYIGEKSFIGSNTVIVNNVHIANGTIIGAGAVVVKSIEKKDTYAGNPAKRLNKIV